jgi:hypothetical protein
MPAVDPASHVPLPTLLSQLLVAFTVELDNEFERRMGEAGYAGARLSLVVWANLIRFLAEGPVAVGELATRSFCPQEGVKAQLGCLERWGFVTLEAANAGKPPNSRGKVRESAGKRDGWGSGRGIRADGRVLPTVKGAKAIEVWPPLTGEIEERWRQRFSNDPVARLCAALHAVVEQFEVELPHSLPVGILVPVAHDFPPRAGRTTDGRSLPVLLSQALFAFANEFDREGGVSLALCANAIRVLGREPVREAELPGLTGSSPETSGVGWQLKPFVVIEPDPAAAGGKVGPPSPRRKVVRLSPRGLEAQHKYHLLVEAIELDWQDRFGKRAVGNFRKALEAIRESRDGDHSRLAAGLVPPAGVVRAGDAVPALGRRDVGSAARKRARELVAQSEAFVRDPLGSLPHFPLWDMNRGYGP